jgi:inosose dehydratase
MTIKIGNAPCSWGVEFAGDPRNPDWKQVLKDCAAAGYSGIELGPVGFMPEDPPQVAEALAEHGLELIGGVIFRAFHDPDQPGTTCWMARCAPARRSRPMARSILVMIDSISPRRAPTAGRADAAEQMDQAEWAAYRDRIAHVAKMGAGEYGLTVGIHAHAAGFMDFEPELERLLDEVDESILKICFDTGHHSYAGFDPGGLHEAPYRPHQSYMHFKDIDPGSEGRCDRQPHRLLRGLRAGHLLQPGQGDVDFPAVRQILLDARFRGLVHRRAGLRSHARCQPIDDARANRAYLASIGF